MNTPTTPLTEVALSAPTAVGFPVNVPPWALDLVGQLQPALVAAKLIIAAGMAPRGYDKPEQIVVACAMGARLGLDPFSAMAGIAVVNGRPTLYGDAMLAVCQGHPAFDDIAEAITGTGDAMTATVTVKRKGRGNYSLITLTWDSATRRELPTAVEVKVGDDWPMNGTVYRVCGVWP
jgi:hypothetical protein